jgi:hypothetical protein
MPFRLDHEGFPDRAKIQFTTSARMPHDIYQACLATGTVSNTRYIQVAVCTRLAIDLDIPVDELIDALPQTRGPAAHLADPDQHPMSRNHTGIALAPSFLVNIGPANTNEEVK